MGMTKVLGIISTNYRIDAIERISDNRPLSAVPFGGRYRLMDFALSNIVNGGIRTVGIILPYRMRPFLDHIAAGKAWNLDRHSGGLFMLPSVTPALKPRVQLFCVKDFLANIEFVSSEEADTVIITASNYVANIEFADVIRAHQEEKADVTLVYKNGLKGNPKAEAKILLDDAGRVIKIRRSDCDQKGEELPSTFADVFVFNRKLFLELVLRCRDSEFKDVLDLVESVLETRQVRGYEFKGYMKKIFKVNDYYEASMDLLNPEIKKELFDGEYKIMTKIKDSPPTKYGDRPNVHNSMISSGCIIEGEILNSIIFRNVGVKPSSQITGCVIMQNCVVGENSILENVILDKGIAIPANTVLKAQEKNPMYLPKGTKV